MTPAPKRPRITREDAITNLKQALDHETCSHNGSPDAAWEASLRMAIRALKREQKAAKTKKKETKR